jgi:hypothetical protein
VGGGEGSLVLNKTTTNKISVSGSLGYLSGLFRLTERLAYRDGTEGKASLKEEKKTGRDISSGKREMGKEERIA